MSTNDRLKAGPADPETRRKKLREALGEPTRGEGTVKRPEPAARPKGRAPTLSEALDPGRKRKRRTGDGRTMEEVVSDAVDGAPKRPIK